MGGRWHERMRYHTIRISLQSKAAASIVSAGNGPRPMLIPKSFSGSGGSALAGAGQAGFGSPAGSWGLRKAAGLQCGTCHLCCRQERAFDWPFAAGDALGLSFGTSDVHRSRPNFLGSCISFAVGCGVRSASGIWAPESHWRHPSRFREQYTSHLGTAFHS